MGPGIGLTGARRLLTVLTAILVAAGVGVTARIALAAGGGAGTNIGDAAALTGTVTGSLASANQQDWYVFYPATPETQVSIEVTNTLASSAGTCSYLAVSLLNSDGAPVASTVLSPGGSVTQMSNMGAASDRYFVELTDDNCTPTVGPDVSYQLSVASGGGGTAPSPSSASSTPGTSIGNVGSPLQGDSYYTGTLPDASSDDWYVLYKADDSNAATVRIQNTTTQATNPGCTYVSVSLTNTDGNPIDSTILSQNTAVVWPVTSGGRYFLEFTDDGCNPGTRAPVTYSVEPEPSSEWANPAPFPLQTLQGGVSESDAAALSSGIEYNDTVPGATTEQWFKGEAGTGQSSWVIQNVALIDENCNYIAVTLFNSASAPIDSTILSRDTAIEYDVSISGTYYIEITDDNCDPTQGTGRSDPPPVQVRQMSTASTFTLGVSRNGSGSGTITSADGGINCGSTCSHSYLQGAAVTLTATPDSGSTFAGWSGGGCSGISPCTVTMNSDQTVTATFNQSPHTLTVEKSGTGSGTVTSSPAGIDCGSSCSTSSSSFAAGTAVTLTATPDSGSAFAGWSGGGCSGTGPCTVTMSSDQTVTATFNAQSCAAGTCCTSAAGAQAARRKPRWDFARAKVRKLRPGTAAVASVHTTTQTSACKPYLDYLEWGGATKPVVQDQQQASALLVHDVNVTDVSGGSCAPDTADWVHCASGSGTAPKKNWPVMIERGQNLVITQLGIKCGGNCRFITNGTLEGHARLFEPNAGKPEDLLFKQTGVSLDSSQVVVSDVESTGKLPDEAALQHVTIKWTISQGATTIDIGTTTHTIYETLGQVPDQLTLNPDGININPPPLSSPDYLSLLQLASQGADGATTRSEALNGIWRLFTNPNPTDPTVNPLHRYNLDPTAGSAATGYWGTTKGSALSYWYPKWSLQSGFSRQYAASSCQHGLGPLLNTGFGTCQAIDELFMTLLAAEGVNSQMEAPGGLEWKALVPHNASYFLVGNWSWDGLRVPNQFFNYVDKLNYGSTLADLTISPKNFDYVGSDGQNNPQPPGFFTTALPPANFWQLGFPSGDHALALVGDKLYDPSYGVGPEPDLQAWAQSSIHGWAILTNGAGKPKCPLPGSCYLRGHNGLS